MSNTYPPGHRLYSSVPEGAFPQGAQLPWEHPDQIRIMNALEGRDPDTPMEPPQPLTAESFADPVFRKRIEDEAAQMRREILEDPVKANERQVDHHVKNFLMNFMSTQRATGCYPDFDFNEALREVMTPKGRREYGEFISQQMAAAQRHHGG